MTKFFRENNKKLLAIFGVVLMIAFVLPSGMKQFSGGQRQLVGYLNGGEKGYNTPNRPAQTPWGVFGDKLLPMPPPAGGQGGAGGPAPGRGPTPPPRQARHPKTAH